MLGNSEYELCTTYDVICSCFCFRSWDQQNCEGRRPKEVTDQVTKTGHYHHYMTSHDISHLRCSRQRLSWVHPHSWSEPVKQRNTYMQYDWSRYTCTLYMYVCHTNHTLDYHRRWSLCWSDSCLVVIRTSLFSSSSSPPSLPFLSSLPPLLLLPSFPHSPLSTHRKVNHRKALTSLPPPPTSKRCQRLR